MLNFLRKLRRNNLNSRYLKYAIGEIVLVVIGILIALGINNLNEERKLDIQLHEYMRNLKSDLADQAQIVENQIVSENTFADAANYIIDEYQSNRTWKFDSLFFMNATALTYRNTFIIVDPTYTDLLSSGRIGLLEKSNLKSDVLSYYQELERVEKVINYNNTLLVDQNYGQLYSLIGYYFDNTFLNTIKFNKPNPRAALIMNLDPELKDISQRLIEEPKNKLSFLNAVQLRYILAVSHQQDMITLKKETNELIKKLTEYLEEN